MTTFVRYLRFAAFAVIILPALSVATHAADDIVIADFEGKDYGDWKVVGEAFGTGPAHGTIGGQMQVSGFLGKGLVNSFFNGDRTTGTLTSPEFAINRQYLTFLIGGGGTEGKTCMNLLVDGKVVRTVTGPNRVPGGSERLDPQAWDVSDLQGKKARIQTVDLLTGGWGHINVDQIALSDRKPAMLLRDQRRDVMIEKRYLNFPVKTGAPKRKMSVIADGQPVREFTIELADAAPEFWCFLDVSAFKGKNLSIQVDQAPEDSPILKSIEQSDTIKGAENLYHEPLRSQFHFSTRRGWNNDPNGLVYHKGEYHLYYQYNPYGWAWGNMHWGHAVSKDLVHWEELPIAIYPKQFGDWVYSGSAVIDKDNTAGFKKGNEDVMVAAYTSTGRGESIAYSNDRGRTFTDYEGNPVVKHKGRDPKVIWHEATKQWVMALYDESEGKKWIAFYTASDLKNWTYQSRIENFFECPELFEIGVMEDVDPNHKERREHKEKADSKKWVAYGADGAYVVGAFDGKNFTIEQAKQRYNYGNCFYASQTFNNIPPEDGRRIQIGWGQVKTPGMPFNQLMLFPCELTLRKTTEGYRLHSMPVKEIESLRGRKYSWKNEAIKSEPQPLQGVAGELLDISAEFAPGEAEELGLTMRDATIKYDAKKQELSCQGKTAPLPMLDGKIRLRILVDRTTIEIFANDGAIYMPVGAVPKEGAPKTPEIFAKGAGAKIVSMDIHELSSIWK